MRRGVALISGCVLVACWGCGEDPIKLGTPDREVCGLMRRDGVAYCIDTYEASRDDATDQTQGAAATLPHSLENRLPWTDITWDGARMACVAKKKRLCERDEWIDACDGAVGEAMGTKYTYGDTLDTTRTTCDVGGMGAKPGGSFAMCKSTGGVFDMSGNVAEWTGSTIDAASARGGSFRSSINHACKDESLGVAAGSTSPEIGFRCCRNE